jgi:4-carboxymuconolactone decarboxylase
MTDTLFDKGVQLRREVLGSAYVDRALAGRDEFSGALQQLVTEFAWGSVWPREGLQRSTRSLLCIVMLTALNRPHELRLHLEAALRNGCSVVEIREALLQTAIYCGVPAAIDAFRLAREVLQEHGITIEPYKP